MTFNESSFGRILQHMQQAGKTFSVISAYREYYSKQENQQRHKQLKQDVRSLNLGYIEQTSGYQYDDGTTAQEESLFIPQIEKLSAINIGKRYEQESILFKDATGFFLINCDTTRIEMTFGKEGITFNQNIIKFAFSALKKGSVNQRGRKFAFLVEHAILMQPTRFQSYQAQREGKKLPVSKWLVTNLD